MNSYTIRRATIQDIPFLVETIIEAEKSGSERLSYATIFGLSIQETNDCLQKILQEEIDGCELSLSSFLVAERHGEIAAAVGAWLEGEEGVSSTSMKGSLLACTLPLEVIKRASTISNIIGELHIEVARGVLQIGLVYVSPDHRGNNLTQQLIKAQIERSKSKMDTLTEVHVQVFGNNLPAIRVYEKCGFKKIGEVECSTDAILDYLPGRSKILMKLGV
ncbi:GNAT family N-acetyltransferase [Ferruginibacter paludis]|uniref:GNAT family N-acetyltransferase n=1 Tax=Ferruginibacter paludis TaxID=1310417 RepID=UPI0025B60446|nr:GNAT family N-acetyltransferase [Ferruginibacter paludis]MDN3658906.1 GNAT family N-acetyltransferase [Ferruginibacter paludis]